MIVRIVEVILNNVKPQWFILMVSFFAITCQFIEKYVFDDWTFLTSVFVLIILDTVLGLIYHAMNYTLSSRGFASMFVKVTIYCAFLSAVHVLTTFAIKGEPNHIFGWVTAVAYSGVIVREFMSIVEHVGRLSQDALPVWLIRMFKNFDETGKYTPTESDKTKDHE